jgi:nicotinate dehydrogenase subunit B
MNAPIKTSRFSRRAVLKGGALTVGFAMAGLRTGAHAQGAAGAGRVLDAKEVDAFLAVNSNGTVTLYSGKVDLGQGLRIALPQMAAEELGIGVDKIKFVEGDTAITPDQGRTSGSNGIQRGGVQIRQAAATAREGLIALAAQRLNANPGDLIAIEGEVRPKAGGAGVSFASLVAGKKFDLKLDPKAPLKDPSTYTIVGKPLPRPDVPAKCTGAAIYVHDFSVPNMLHARVIRPPAIGANLTSVDENSIKDLPGAKMVRIKNFLAVVADDEWTSVRAARALRAQWSEGSGLPEQNTLAESLRNASGMTDESLVNKGTAPTPLPDDAKQLTASYYWPMQSHGSMGPSCAVADVRADSATIWTASQGTHGNRTSFSKFLGMPAEKVRLIYLEGSGCYGMNGHEDAAADEAIISRAVGRPVRVQWSREDELGFDPKGPPQLIDISGAVSADGRNVAAKGDTGAAQYSAARTRCGRHPAGAGTQFRAGLAERRPALCGGPHPGDRALAEGRTVASRADPLAGKAGQLLCGRELRGRACAGGGRRSGRVPAARPQRPARDRSRQADGRPHEVAAPGFARRRRRRARRARTRHLLHPLQTQRNLCRDGHGGCRRACDRQYLGRARRLRA